jgi:hypothetical protein
MISYGNHQLDDHNLDPNRFTLLGLSAIYFTQISNALKIGFGSDLNYWIGIPKQLDVSFPTPDFKNSTIGFIIQPEFIFDRFTMVSGIGIYATHIYFENFQQIYQRLGVRYEFYKNLSAGINIRAINFKTAQFIEFNLGYKIRWIK